MWYVVHGGHAMVRRALLAAAWACVCCAPSVDAIAVRRNDVAGRAQLLSSVTPVEKVIELLGELSTKVQEEGKEEAVSYDKFACFCKEQADSKIHGISKANSKIEELDALIEQLQGDIAQLALDMQAAKADVETERNASAAAVQTRSATHDSFLTEQAELKQAVDVCQHALDHLLQTQSQVNDEALLQKRSQEEMTAVAHALAKLSHVQGVPRPVSLASVSGAVGAPAPAGAEAAYMPYNGPTYEYSSGVVIDTLRSVKRTFQEQLTELEEGETSDEHSFNMMEGARANRITALQATISQNQKLIAEKSVEEQEATKVMDDEITARDADQTFLDQLTVTCQEKASLWDQRSKMRSSELAALTQGLELLKSTSETYNVNKKLVGLVAKKAAPPQQQVSRKQAVAAPAFVQLAQVEKPAWSQKLSKFLQGKAQSLGSASLLSLALSLQRAGNSTVPSDPFVRVRSLINDLITRLEGEASAEANQKTFCDTEMGSATSERDARALEMEQHKASISKTESAITQLEGDIAELTEELASLRKALLEMTELRNEEKAQHNATESVALEGVETLKQAIDILGEFYSGSSLLQRRYTPPGADREGKTVFDLAPKTFDSEYSGKIAESKGIIGLLQVILSDFERTATTTAEAEAAAQAEFVKQSQALNTEISSKDTALQSLEGDLETEKSNLVGFKDSLNDAETLHSNAEQELQTLKASCVDAEESWEERKRHREQEIEALKEALKILREWQE